MFDVSKYTIGWVCNTEQEVVAAKLHLDEEHDSTEYVQTENDENNYTFGSIGRHNVVVASPSAGIDGSTNAAVVAKAMLRAFPEVYIGVVVGIAGGAPTKDQDIRLGDVVVSLPGDAKSGLIHYDLRKAVLDQGTKIIEIIETQPSVSLESLETAVIQLRVAIGQRELDIGKTVTALLTPVLEKEFSRPDTSTDRLYQSSYVHTGDEGCAVSCDSGKLVMRPQREDQTVKVHYGLIALAESLMGDAMARDAVAGQGVLCCEMEATALMDDPGFLHVRGICDYADSHKNLEWRGYAAMTAAAYTKLLIVRLPQDAMEVASPLFIEDNGADTMAQHWAVRHSTSSPEVEDTRLKESSDEILALEMGLSTNETSAHSLQAFLSEHQYDRVRDLIMNEFDTVAQQQYEWLHELVSSGYSRPEIADLLIDTEQHVPWVYVDGQNDNIIQVLSPEYHVRGCIHRSKLAISDVAAPQEGVPTIEGFLEDTDELEHARHVILKFCGLAGVVPWGRNESSWTGRVVFSDNNSTASVSFSDPSSSFFEHSLETRLAIVTEHVLQAFTVLQRYELCCNYISLLVLRPRSVSPSGSLAELQRIEVKDALDFLHLMGTSDPPSQLVTLYAERVLGSLYDGAPFEGVDDLSPSEGHWHVSALALQVLGLGILSYSHGHCQSLDIAILADPLETVHLCGMNQDPGHNPCVSASMTKLTCLAGVVGGVSVLVMRPALASSAIVCDVLASPVDLVDLWGPGAEIRSPDLASDNQILAIMIGEGLVTGSQESPHLHWSSIETGAQQILQHAIPIERDKKYTIGAVRENANCTMRDPGIELAALKDLDYCMDILGTYNERWSCQSKSCTVGGGQHITAALTFVKQKFPGRHAKEELVDLWNKDQTIRPEDLNSHFGLQLSLCTGLARRVSLRELLADVVSYFVEYHENAEPRWQSLKTQLVANLQVPGFGRWFGSRSDEERSTIDRILKRLLLHLARTGIDRNGSLNVAWIKSTDIQNCFRFDCDLQHNRWLKLLSDSDHCATFACITTKCLPSDYAACTSLPSDDKRPKICRIKEVRSAVYMQLQPDGHDDAFALQAGSSFDIGPVNLRLLATVESAESVPPILSISASFIDQARACINRMKKRQQLRERGKLFADTSEVAMVSKAQSSRDKRKRTVPPMRERPPPSGAVQDL